MNLCKRKMSLGVRLTVWASAWLVVQPCFAQGAASEASAETAVPSSDAPSAQTCAGAFEAGQSQRAAEDLVGARAHFVACSQIACPQLLVKECIGQLERLDADIPSFGLRVRGNAGQELFDVRIEMDGKLLTEQLSGERFSVNPGVHRFSVTAEGYKPMEVAVSILVGERDRLIELKLEELFPTASPPSGEAPPRSPPQATQTSSGFVIPAASYVAAGVGILGLGAFGYFRIVGSGDYDKLKTSCGATATCTSDQTSSVKESYLYSNVGLGIGLAGLVTSAVVAVALQPGGEARGSEPAVSLSVGPSRAALQVTF